tara:strand:- start:806 stop:2431 length:1626 start_codon:yes stop_codon:yes gene_type:complete
MILSSFMDFLSIALLVPIITLVQKQNIDESSFTKIFEILNFQTDIQSIIILLVCLIITKGFLTILIVYLQANYISLLQNYFRENIFLNYLYNKSEDLFQDHSSTIYRNIVTEVSEFAGNYIGPILNLTTNLILFLFMTTLIFIVDANSATFIFITLLSSFIIVKFSLGKILKKLALVRFEKDTEYYKVISNSISFIKDIKFFNLQKFYKKRFLKVLYRTLQISRTRAVLGQLPRVSFEVIFVLIFSFILLFNQENERILITLAVYAAAALRVLPAINQISTSYQKMKFSKSSFKTINENLEKKNYDFISSNTLDYKNELIIKNLSFKYQINKHNTLNDLNLSLSGSEKISIVGESGAGKSTLLNLILGFLEPQDKEMIKSNENSIYDDVSSWKKNISYVPQKVVILDQSLKNNIILSNPDIGFDEKLYFDSIKKAGLTTLLEKLEYQDETLLGDNGDKISMGEKQRIGIARAIYRNSQIVIMDEISNFLDEKNKQEIIKNIYAHFKDKIIITVTHDQNILKYSDKIYELKDKKLNLIKRDN